jgi:predicted acylesterase/phospholipase RssA/CRP-like cAMP-binding protein
VIWKDAHDEEIPVWSPRAGTLSAAASSAPAPDLLSHFEKLGLLRDADEEVRKVLGESIQRVVLEQNQVLFAHGEASDAMYVIIRGALDVFVPQVEASETLIDTLEPREPVGELQLLAGGSRTATVRARERTELARLAKSSFEAAAVNSPELIQHMAELIHRRLQHYRCESILPRLFGPLDAAMMADLCSAAQWIHLRRGEPLFQQGDPDCSLYIVMSGRLQAIVSEQHGLRHVIGEISTGESVGEMALFTGEERSAAVVAIRDSELLKFSQEAFRDISVRYPQVTAEITKIIIQRFRRSRDSRQPACRTVNICVLAVAMDFSLEEFTRRLATELATLRCTLHLSSGVVDELLGTPRISQIAENDPNAIRLETWLDEQESKYEYVLYESDAGDSNWTRRCFRQADRVLLVGDAASDPRPGPIERELLEAAGELSPRQTLVLMHREADGLPSGTFRWLQTRRVDGWHHLRQGRVDDFQRLARILTGTAVGVVLSGGGAKGYAHIGVLRAFQEAGVPIDMVGGTSMGSVIAAAHAIGYSPEEIAEINKKGFAQHKPFKEYTLPLVSLLRSRRLDRLLQEQTRDIQVEDLWTNFFCVSTNLTAAEPVIHTRGSLFKAIRASISIPGILVPVIDGENLLVDGGVVNNLPGDVMRGFCPGTVIMVDVAPQRGAHVQKSLRDFPSPWKILGRRLNPFQKSLEVPNILQILGRTTMLGSIHQLNLVRGQADYYLRVPVEQYGMLDFEAIDEIVEAGYRYAVEEIQQWSGLARDHSSTLGAGASCRHGD